MASATGDSRRSIGMDKFDLPLPSTCLDFHVFKRGDVRKPLLSVGKVCDAGMTVVFTADKCQFFDPAAVKTVKPATFSVPRKGPGYLWTTVSRSPTPEYTANLSRSLGQPYKSRSTDAYTVPNLLRYLHACAGFPVTATWLQAIRKGYFIGWPGLYPGRVMKYLPKSTETFFGHLRLVKQGIPSTTSKGDPTDEPEEQDDIQPMRTSKALGRRRNVMVNSIPIIDIAEQRKLTGIIGTDQTGRFPTESARGHKYIFILCDQDTNLIHGVPIKSRKTDELIRAFKESHTALVKCGFQPILHRIDNETSNDLIKAIESRGLLYETVPPGNHRRNPAERAIQSFKSHFISIMNGLHKDYPANGWDLLMPQMNLTLNLLRECKVNPSHSAYSYIYGTFDFSAHPLAPLGCKAIVHDRAIGKGGKRHTWANRGREGFYIGPAMHSYRVWRFYMPDTKSIVASDTAEFFPLHVMPTLSMEAIIATALQDIQQALTDMKPPHTNFSDSTDAHAVIGRLNSMFDGQSDLEIPPAKFPRVANPAAPPQRVIDSPNPTINAYQPKKKQKYNVGTKVRIPETIRGKRVVFTGHVRNYDSVTGLYTILFEDGEEDDDFDEDDVEAFKVKNSKPKTFSNNTMRHYPNPNPICISGFYPKANRSHPRLHHAHNAGSIYDEELHKWMSYKELLNHPNPIIRKRWQQAGMNEFARLAQGYGSVEGMDVINFIARNQVPQGKRATYARYVVDYRPEKDEPWRLRITCGGDRLEYHGNTTTHSASMETIKCQLNNIVSTKGAKAACGDISNMYLGSDLPEAEYVRFLLSLIPEEIIIAYNLRDMATSDGYVYAQVNKAWYGLKQAGKIAHDDLVQRLSEAGYTKAPLVEGYFRHETRQIDFTLVVDDFLIKYTKDEDLQHLRDAINKYYKFKVDLEAKQYVGIHLNWDYINRTVRLSMEGYIEQALLELEHTQPTKPHYAPSRYTMPQFGSRVQYVQIDQTATLGGDKINFIQKVVGKLLYYARAVDPTMLHAINDISLQSANGTEATLDAVMYLLNYAHTNPGSEVIYRASDMILHVDSDAAYLVAPEARSRAGGYQYLSTADGSLFNGPVLVLAKVIKNVMASATEAELAALFMNGQEAVALRNCLHAMGYEQPATPLKTDNNTANGIINNAMKQRRSKAIDVRFYWLRDRTKQGQFKIYWDAGKNNIADYFTKHHPPAHHKQWRPVMTYVKGSSPSSLQGCIEIITREKQPRGGSHKNTQMNQMDLVRSLTGNSPQ